MTTSFRSSYLVVKRNPGQWIDGIYFPEPLGQEITVQMSVQQPSSGDNNAIEMLPFGGRVSRYIKAYTDTRLTAVSQQPGGHPGDLIVHEGRNYLVIGEASFHTMVRTRPDTPVSHYRYYAAEVVEPDDIMVSPHD